MAAEHNINPTNTAELQLFRVLEKSKLLQYYHAFIEQGGDDVQQLCEAGEEEFLEIMALVGMSSKPLHVRRLQKALQEWVTDPVPFLKPLDTPPPVPVSTNSCSSLLQSISNAIQAAGRIKTESTPSSKLEPFLVPKSDAASMCKSTNGDGGHKTPEMRLSPSPSSTPSSTTSVNPVLLESQIEMIASAAKKVAETLPDYEPKLLNMKKDVNRETLAVMKISEEDPGRMDLLRKYGSIYGRFDCKRKSDKPMSMFEISVNEAAAQLCRHRAALLTRRDDLFPLARTVVKQSGYQYAKGHSKSNPIKLPPQTPEKKLKTDDTSLDSPVDEDQQTVIDHLCELQKDLQCRIDDAVENNDFEVSRSLEAELEEVKVKKTQIVLMGGIYKRTQDSAVDSSSNSYHGYNEEDTPQSKKIKLEMDQMSYDGSNSCYSMPSGVAPPYSDEDCDEQEMWNREIEKDSKNMINKSSLLENTSQYSRDTIPANS